MNRLFFFVALSTILITINNGAYADMPAHAINLPETIGNWTRSKDIKIINPDNIFQYMNGAGELYLSYGLDHVQVITYKNSEQDDILVELYLMNNSDDAFGLLSLDWEGEPVKTGPVFSLPSGKSTVTPSHRSYYGAGLLRMATDTVYVRILSYRETPESKSVVISLGESIAKNRKVCPEPKLLKRLPQEFAPGYQLQKKRIGYFHSYLVLNNLYYISHENILNLDYYTNAVFATYKLKTDSDTKKIQLLKIQYPDKDKASMALEQFFKIYLPEFSKKLKSSGKIIESNSFKIEDGVVGYRINGSYLSILFELDDLQLAQTILEQISQK